MSNQCIKAQVEEISPLTDSVLKLMLAPEKYIDYQAGQYLQLICGEESFSYSIANAPLGSHKYELHIRHSPENPYNQSLLAEIKQFGTVTLRLPLGNCHINRLHAQKPILFIAAGTGFAPIKAMIEQLLIEGQSRRFELFWGARSQSDLYLDEKVKQWQMHVPQFKYHSFASQSSKETLGSLALSYHEDDLADWQVVISGPFDLVYNTRDLLLSQGALQENLFSDAFSFEASKT